MQIVWNEEIKEAIKQACEYAHDMNVDIDIHVYTDGELSISVCPTYRDRPQTETGTDCSWK